MKSYVGKDGIKRIYKSVYLEVETFKKLKKLSSEYNYVSVSTFMNAALAAIAENPELLIKTLKLSEGENNGDNGESKEELR